jgi:hypothetical protein
MVFRWSAPHSRAVIFLSLVLLPLTTSADWRADVQRLGPGPVPPAPDMTLRYVFGWSGIEAAGATVNFRAAGAGYRAEVEGGTTGWARSLYKLDADYVAEVDGRSYRSREFRLTENYATYGTEEKAYFRPGGVRTWRESTKQGAKPPKWKNFYVPGLRDMAAAVMLARSQPLNKGDRLSLAVFPGDWMYLARVKVEGREKLRWRGGEKEAIRLSLKIDRINEDYSLGLHKKFDHGTIWVSDDDLRVVLRIEVKVFVGHVFAELVEFKAGQRKL